MNQATTQILQNKAAQTESADTHINKQSNGELIKVADLAKHKFYDFYTPLSTCFSKVLVYLVFKISVKTIRILNSIKIKSLR